MPSNCWRTGHATCQRELRELVLVSDRGALHRRAAGRHRFRAAGSVPADGIHRAAGDVFAGSDLSDLGARDSVNRQRHMRLKVGERVRAPDGSDSGILVRDTWNTEIVAEPSQDDLVLWKTRFSGFYQTSLHEDLQRFACRHLIVTGCTTSICVDSTVRDAMFRDYLPVLLSDCMSEPIGANLVRTNHEASLLSTEVLLGWISDSEHVVHALG